MPEPFDLSPLFGQATPEASPFAPYPPPSWQQFAAGADQPGVINREAALSLSDRDIINQVRERRHESKRARLPLESDWIWYTRLYHNRLDTDDKALWQAQVFIPEIYNKVETACSLIKGALLDSPDWFQLQQYESTGDESQIRFIQRLLAYLLEQSGFVDKYMLALREGFLLGSGCLAFDWHDWIETKPHVEQVPLYSDMNQAMAAMQLGMPTSQPTVSIKELPRNTLRIRHVPLWAMYPDPYGKNFEDCKYIVEEMKVDREELEEGLAAGKYDSLDNIGEPVPWDLEDEYRHHQVELEQDKSSKRKRDLLTIYYGNFYSEDGKLALKNWRCVIANWNAVIALSPNPYYTGRRPYLWSTPLPFAGRPWGRPAVAAAATEQEELNKLVNLILDNAAYAALTLFRADPDGIYEPLDLQSAEPGKIIKGKKDAIEQIAFPFVGNNLWPLVQFLQNGISDATRIQDIAEGQPTSRGRATATEIQTVGSMGQAHIHNLARDLERNDLETAVQMAYEMAMQFMSDASDPGLQAIIQAWQGPMPLHDPMLRLELLDVAFKVKARGVSMILKREELAQKLMQVLQLAQSFPLPPLNLISIFYQLVQNIGLDPTQLGLPPSPQEAIAAMQQIAAMQAAQAAPGGLARRGGPSPSAPEPTGSPQSPPMPNDPQDVAKQVQLQGPTLPMQ